MLRQKTSKRAAVDWKKTIILPVSVLRHELLYIDYEKKCNYIIRTRPSLVVMYIFIAFVYVH